MRERIQSRPSPIGERPHERAASRAPRAYGVDFVDAAGAGGLTRAPAPGGFGGVLQGKFDFDPARLEAEQSSWSRFDPTISRWNKIRWSLDAYFDAKDVRARHRNLAELNAHIAAWKRDHGDAANPSAKESLLDELLAAAGPKLDKLTVLAASAEFMTKFKPGNPGLIERMVDPLRKTRAGKLDDQGLSPAERASIRIYMGDQHKLINPSVAGNADWARAWPDEFADAGKKQRINTKQLAKLMEQNVRIGAMMVSGLQKLPDWNGNTPLFRGETVTTAEAQKLQNIDYTKTFDHFVSTSQDVGTPTAMLNSNKSAARPVGVLYTVVSSSGGKDIAGFNKDLHEQEILFLPGSKLTVRDVDAPSEDRLELEVHCKGAD